MLSRRGWPLILLLLLLPTPWAIPPSRGVTSVSGLITADTVWSPPETYLIAGDTTVVAGVTLTILAGTTVLFQTNHTDDNFPRWRLEVRGNLHILGTEAQPVRFASDHPDPTRNDWDSVLLEDTRDARIENATFEYARIALDVRNSTVRMVHVRLLESAFAGLQVDRGLPTSQSVVVVEDSLLSANATTGEFGILNEQNGAVIWRGTARFRRCEFAENLVGLMTLEGATVEVEDSLFANNWVGLFAVGAQVTMRRSEVRHNGLPGFGGVGITLLGGSLGRVEDSRLENNGFGLDIDYSSRASVRLSRNVTVNGIPLEEIYYVGRADELMRGARMDSGRTGGFVGNVSFQGGLTLYDSRNLTFEDLSLEYNLQNLWAENSTFTLVNSTLRDATVNIALREGGDVLLKQFSVGYFVNTIFNRTSVAVSDDLSRLWVESFVRGHARTELGAPMPGIEIVLTPGAESLGTTDASGFSPWLRGPQGFYAKRPGQSATDFTAVDVQIRARGADFQNSPRRTWMDAPRTELFVRFDITRPLVAEALPPDGAREVGLGTPVTIVFSEPMNTSSVEGALSVEGHRVTHLVWRDGNRSLTFTIDDMRAGETFVVQVSSEARDAAGNRLDPLVFSFTATRATRDFEPLPVLLVAGTLLAVGMMLVALWRRSRSGQPAGEEQRGETDEGDDDPGE